MAGTSDVPVHELNQNTAGVLARVKRGEQIPRALRRVEPSLLADVPVIVALVTRCH